MFFAIMVYELKTNDLLFGDFKKIALILPFRQAFILR